MHGLICLRTMAKKKSKHKLHYGDQGQFRWETYFVGGKQKRRKIRLIKSMEPDEFIRANADEIWLLQEGLYEELESKSARW